MNIPDSGDVIRGLERGDFHVALMRPPTNANLLQFRPLIKERFVAVIPRRSPLVARPVLRLADFVDHKVFALKRFELSSFEVV